MKNIGEKLKSANQIQDGIVSGKRKSGQERRGGGGRGGGGGGGAGCRHRMLKYKITKK